MAGTARTSQGTAPYAAVAANVWDPPAALAAAFSRARQAHARVLPILAEALDEVHRSDRGERYWKVVLGPFTIWYLETVLDRLQGVRAALVAAHAAGDREAAGATAAAALRANPPAAPAAADPPPADTRDFMRLASESDAWNARLRGRIGALLGERPAAAGRPAPAAAGAPAPGDDPLPEEGGGFDPGPALAAIKRSVTPLLARASTVVHLSYGLGLADALRLALGSGGEVQRFEPVALPLRRERARDEELRSALAHALERGARAARLELGELERVALRLLVDDLPATAVERHRQLAARAARVPYRNATQIVSDDGWYFDEVFKAWAAERANAGARLVAVQHGGGYGAREVDTGEWFERSVTDRFISWGWTATGVVPLPSPRLSAGLGRRLGEAREAPTLLWAGNAVPPHVFSYESWPQADQYLAYLAWQKRFLAALSEEVLARLTFRPYTRDYGRDAIGELRRVRPGLQVDAHGKLDFLGALAGSAGFLCDNLNTTYLQAMALDVPTVLFWDPEVFRSNAEHRVWEERLEAVGVLHRTPEDAARHLGALGGDLGRWWLEPDVRRVVLAYRRRYAHAERGWLRTWRAALAGPGPGGIATHAADPAAGPA